MKASNETELVEGLFFGGTSIDLGYLTERQFEEVLEIRAKLLGMGLSEGAAQVCIQKNYMTLEQVEEVKEAKSELEQAHTEQSGAVRPKNKLKLCVGGGTITVDGQVISKDGRFVFDGWPAPVD